MSYFIYHAQNLRSGFMFNRGMQFSQSQGIKIQFLSFGAVNPASYLCNFNFSHWYIYNLALTVKYFFHMLTLRCWAMVYASRISSSALKVAFTRLCGFDDPLIWQAHHLCQHFQEQHA